MDGFIMAEKELLVCKGVSRSRTSKTNIYVKKEHLGRKYEYNNKHNQVIKCVVEIHF